MDKLPVGMLLNEVTKRYHPIVFRPVPMISGTDKDFGTIRHKSLGHHREGFNSLEEAKMFINNQLNWSLYDVLWSWNGNEIPAITTWISLKEIQKLEVNE